MDPAPRRRSRQRPSSVLAGVAGLLATVLISCSTTGADPTRPVPTGSPVAAPSTVESRVVPADVLDPLLDDAVTRTGAARESITVVEAEATTWPTGALGCPVPGLMYTQALVDGWRVILLAGEKRIDYRATGPGNFRVCEGILGG